MLKAAGYGAAELHDVAYSPVELMGVGFTVKPSHRLKHWTSSVRLLLCSLLLAPCTLLLAPCSVLAACPLLLAVATLTSPVIGPLHMKVAELRLAECDPTSLRNAGCTVRQLKEGGYRRQ